MGSVIECVAAPTVPMTPATLLLSVIADGFLSPRASSSRRVLSWRVLKWPMEVVRIGDQTPCVEVAAAIVGDGTAKDVPTRFLLSVTESVSADGCSF